jgi:hypothetical protein
MAPPLYNKKHTGRIKPAVFVAWYYCSRNEDEVILISNLPLTILKHHYTSSKLAKSSGERASNKTLIYTLFLTQMRPTCTIKPGYHAMRRNSRLGAEVFARLLYTSNNESHPRLITYLEDYRLCLVSMHLSKLQSGAYWE